MHDFGKLVYLDLQKTGSTFVSRFLSETCNLRVVREWKHGRIYSRRRRNVFYFITVRHPVAQYSSLFRYGLDRKGALYERLAQFGFANLYNSNPSAFSRWLRFILDHGNAKYLGEGFEQIPASYNIGFLSYRFLMLSFSHPEATMLRKPISMDILRYLQEKSIVNHVIKNEQLDEGLIELATKIKPEYFYQEKVREFFETNTRANKAKISAEMIGVVERDLQEMICEKERVLCSFYS